MGFCFFYHISHSINGTSQDAILFDTLTQALIFLYTGIRNLYLNAEKVITLPYADDFCIITTNKVQHQKLINNIEENTESMGLKLKPSKCRSFSTQKGKPTINYFKSQETLKHVLSYCPVSLRQGRLTWRHDGIVRFIATSINQTKYKV